MIVCKIPHISASDTIEAMEEMRKDGVSAIAMVPSDEEAVKEKIREFTGVYQIPIVTFNSDVPDTGRLCFVGQNGIQCGKGSSRSDGRELVNGTGKIAIISGYQTNPSLRERVDGFTTQIEKSIQMWNWSDRNIVLKKIKSRENYRGNIKKRIRI